MRTDSLGPHRNRFLERVITKLSRKQWDHQVPRGNTERCILPSKLHFYSHQIEGFPWANNKICELRAYIKAQNWLQRRRGKPSHTCNVSHLTYRQCCLFIEWTCSPLQSLSRLSSGSWEVTRPPAGASLSTGLITACHCCWEAWRATGYSSIAHLGYSTPWQKGPILHPHLHLHLHPSTQPRWMLQQPPDGPHRTSRVTVRLNQS